MTGPELKKITTVSASSIATFLDCPRKWYIRYVLGERTPPTPAMLHGTRVHKDIEEYYLRQKDEPETIEAIEAKASGLFPDRYSVDPRHVEYKAEALGLELHGLRFLGFIDLPYMTPDGEIAVIDWKTRSSFTYMPDAVELLDDIQGRLYAWIGFELLKREGISQEKIAFAHGNMIRVDGKRGRTSPRSQLVTCTYDRDEIYNWIEGDNLGSIIAEMKATAEIDHPRKVRQETGSCFKYGPCEYKDRPIAAIRGRSCYDIPYRPAEETRRALTESKGESTMALSRLIALRRAQAQQQQQTPSAPSPQPSPPEPQKPEAAAPTAPAGSALERAKTDFEAGKPGFDLLEYDLTHAEKREFVLWRRDLTSAAAQAQRENEIPPVNPPDAAPDEEPVDLDGLSVSDFAFDGVPGIGPKTAESIRDYLAQKGITRLADMLDLDLTEIPGIGRKSAADLRAAIESERIWQPEGAASPVTPTAQAATLAQGAEDLPPEIVKQQAEKPGGTYDQERVFAEMKSAYIEGDREALKSARGRATGDTEIAFDKWRDQYGQAEAQADASAIVADAPEAPDLSPAQGTGPISVLYIDCAPTKGGEGARHLDDLLEPAKAKVAEEEGMRYWSADKYGKGRKILVDVVLEDPTFLTGHVIARSSAEGMEQLLPEIRQFFDLIIEG